MKLISALLITTFGVTAAHADHHSLQIDDCTPRSVANGYGQSSYLLEPWSENSYLVQDHQIRLAVLTNGKDEYPGYYLMVLGKAPTFQHDPGPRQCRIITFEGSTGFSKVDMDSLSVNSTESRGREVIIFSLQVETTSSDSLTQTKNISVGFFTEDGNVWAHFEEI